MATASSSVDADAGDRLKGSATSGVTGLRVAADEAATAAATREQAASPGLQPTTPAPSPRRPRRSRAVSANWPAGRGGRGGWAAGDGRRATQRQQRHGSRRAAPHAATAAADGAGDRCATMAAASSLSRRAPYRRRPPPPRPPAPALPLRRPPSPLHLLPWMTTAASSLSPS
ncbi:hypothetical protein DAI22_01g065108 [Oryza sativa Japonica Group]|nr:hypothetical protein DAI22_01g065108 [Oryza sativa Japonica Group]